jgi:hypothetical protein
MKGRSLEMLWVVMEPTIWHPGAKFQDNKR